MLIIKLHRKVMFLWGSILIVIAGIAYGASSKFWNDPRVIVKVPTAAKIVALTIDDGPHFDTTPRVLAILKEKNVQATFFILGENAKKYPEILVKEIADGHEIAVHAYSHKILMGLSKDKIRAELDMAEAAILAAAFQRPSLFRPPMGKYDDVVLAVAKEKGYTTILWTIDPLDWARPPVKSVVDKVLAQVTPGSIILLHDGQYQLPTPEAIGLIIDQLRNQGYRLVTVGELLRQGEVKHSRH